MKGKSDCYIVGVLLSVVMPTHANAQGVTPGTSVEEIIVTAQKREQSINDVGITIAAATGGQLRDRQITSVGDLPRLVPGFTVQESAFNSTSYTMRGVGFFNSDLATPPTVSVYQDEVPIAFPAMTKLVPFDLERVEVLKGPQGTLYGQNATGGAVNYIAAKPTKSFVAGFDLGYGRFDTVDVGAFLSGPLSDTLAARVAVRGVRGDDWQKSTTRPGDTLGRARQLQGRLTVEWNPDGRFSSRLTATAWHDGSDALAAQLLAPAVSNRASAVLAPDGVTPIVETYPVVLKSRAADWSPGYDYSNDNTFVQVTLRNDLHINDNITLTSLSSYDHFKRQYAQDFDGTPLNLYNVEDPRGEVNGFSQEVRLAGNGDRLNWVVGANYDRQKVFDQGIQYFGDYSQARFPGWGIVAGAGNALGRHNISTWAIFANGEYKISPDLTLQAAVRYNNDSRKFSGCSYDVPHSQDVGGGDAALLTAFQDLLNGAAPPIVIQRGECYVLDPGNNFAPVDVVRRKLNQDNISWKVGLNWKPVPRTLFYANVGKGYKAGSIPVVGAATTDQYNPVPQESVLAYEVGAKSALFDRRLQLNAAAFYYDYRDKQLRGKYLDIIVGPLEGLVSIPKSRVYGFELQAIAKPVRALTIDSSVTYVDTRIKEFVGLSSLGVPGDFAGTGFPFAPKWQSVTDAQYDFDLSEDVSAFVGGTLTYNSKSNSGIGEPEILAIGSYTLVDLRAGLDVDDGRYRITAWGKNITNEYYWSNTFLGFETVTRFVNKPITWGMTLAYRYR